MTDLKLGRTLFARVTNWNKISLELFDVNHSSTFVVKVWIDSKEVFVETFIDHLIMFYCSFAAVLLQFYGRIPNNAKHIGSFSQLLWPKTWKDSLCTSYKLKQNILGTFWGKSFISFCCKSLNWIKGSICWKLNWSLDHELIKTNNETWNTKTTPMWFSTTFTLGGLNFSGFPPWRLPYQQAASIFQLDLATKNGTQKIE